MAIRAIDDDRLRQHDAALSLEVRDGELMMLGAVDALGGGARRKREDERAGDARGS